MAPYVCSTESGGVRLFRYDPEPPSGETAWTELPIGPNMRPFGVATCGGSLHVLGEDVLTGCPVHAVYTPSVEGTPVYPPSGWQIRESSLQRPCQGRSGYISSTNVVAVENSILVVPSDPPNYHFPMSTAQIYDAVRDHWDTVANPLSNGFRWTQMAHLGDGYVLAGGKNYGGVAMVFAVDGLERVS
ncbi:hypothetical protein KIPB_006310 [Kipferlia bialata]|uniref:Uncharacterized protein n=1 Tax=Kipferlia bialata TaxID=797122 RepID=A0A9K3CYN1_9EUKA|nr:hypothetical protein KIPB_006310 [Kipferlia bialata]|eukprot:g6310.t1